MGTMASRQSGRDGFKPGYDEEEHEGKPHAENAASKAGADRTAAAATTTHDDTKPRPGNEGSTTATHEATSSRCC
jgi:hypothetical protein